nr:hypothetical protein [uncultured Steroidobacter sp.]
MNIHTRLVGALDAIILSSLGVATLAMALVLLEPWLDNSSLERVGQRATVTIEQIA